MSASATVQLSAPRLGALLREEGYAYLPAVFDAPTLRALERECDDENEGEPQGSLLRAPRARVLPAPAPGERI